MHGVSWDSALSWDESRDLSLDLRLSLDLSCPPLAPWRLIFVQSAPLAIRDEVLETEEKCSTFQNVWDIVHWNFRDIKTHTWSINWRLILSTSIFFLCCTHIYIHKSNQWFGTLNWQHKLSGYCCIIYKETLFHQLETAWQIILTEIPSRTSQSSTAEYFILILTVRLSIVIEQWNQKAGLFLFFFSSKTWFGKHLSAYRLLEQT